jgi:putative membrane protein
MVLRILLNALALFVADYFIEGIVLSGPVATLIAGLVLGLVNALVKPVLFVLTLPLTFVTLGLFIFVLNGLCLGLTAALVPGFEIAGLWSAVGGALIVTIVSWLLSTGRRSERPRRYFISMR